MLRNGTERESYSTPGYSSVSYSSNSTPQTDRIKGTVQNYQLESLESTPKGFAEITDLLELAGSAQAHASTQGTMSTSQNRQSQVWTNSFPGIYYEASPQSSVQPHREQQQKIQQIPIEHLHDVLESLSKKQIEEQVFHQDESANEFLKKRFEQEIKEEKLQEEKNLQSLRAVAKKLESFDLAQLGKDTFERATTEAFLKDIVEYSRSGAFQTFDHILYAVFLKDKQRFNNIAKILQVIEIGQQPLTVPPAFTTMSSTLDDELPQQLAEEIFPYSSAIPEEASSLNGTNHPGVAQLSEKLRPYTLQIPGSLFNVFQIIPLGAIEDQILEALVSKDKDGVPLSVILVGPPGCGKNQAINRVCKRMFQDDRPLFSNVKFHRMDARRHLDCPKGIIGYLQTVIKEIKKVSVGRDILVVDYIDALFQVPFSKSLNHISSQLHLILQDHPNLQIIAKTHEENYEKLRNLDLFRSCFQPIFMKGMDHATTLKVLQMRFLQIEPSLLESVLHLTERYFPHQCNPLRCIEFINRCLTYLSFQQKDQPFTQTVIWRMLAEKTGLPLTRLLQEPSNDLKEITKRLEEAIVGQDHVLQTVAEKILCIQGGWSNPCKPSMVYVFAGPTGVGKTQLAKRITEVLYDNPDQLIRLDMAEYHDSYTKARLVGAPPGYIGYDDGGQLTTPLAKKPSCVVLLDEIEKAHPDVLKLFLPILDEGRITSAQGKTIDCKNACFILTTNLGTEEIQERMRAGELLGLSQMKEIICGHISKQFGPEWLNRVEVLPFSPITKEIAHKIVEIHLRKLAQELKDKYFIHLHWEEDLVLFLVKKGFQPLVGARPIIELIDKTIRLGIAKASAIQRLERGDHIDCFIQDDQIQMIKSWTGQ